LLYHCIKMPMSSPAPSCTYGKLSAPSALMNCERVIGLRMLYAVMARKENANIITAVAASPSRRVTIRSIMRRPIRSSTSEQFHSTSVPQRPALFPVQNCQFSQ
jgi:hypothetical protein